MTFIFTLARPFTKSMVSTRTRFQVFTQPGHLLVQTVPAGLRVPLAQLICLGLFLVEEADGEGLV